MDAELFQLVHKVCKPNLHLSLHPVIIWPDQAGEVCPLLLYHLNDSLGGRFTVLLRSAPPPSPVIQEEMNLAW